MEEKKILNFIEKMHIEFTSRFDQMDKRFEQMDKRFDQVENRLTKLELGQERLEDRVDEVFEALQSHIEVNDRQHEEIMLEISALLKQQLKES